MRTFTVQNEVQDVDDIMIGIPSCYRDEFVGTSFDSWEALSLCLAHADVARRAKIEGDYRYDDELKAMREYLK